MDEGKIQERLRKLLALARQGEGGEKANAQSILDKMLKKHGLRIEDLDPERLERGLCKFSYGNELEYQLLLQVIFNVLGASSIHGVKGPGNRKTFEVLVTRAQGLEIDLAWSIYRDAFRLEQQRLLEAFVHKNRLYGARDASVPPEKASGHESSKEDTQAILAMMRAIKPTQVYKAIPAKAG